jgi:carbamoyl-phosphate synthase small subunit
MFLSRRAPNLNAALVLKDGTVFWGRGIGKSGVTGGEVCFNTAMTGYQESLTDPSYCGQMITFTFPHIGNVGTNADDMESRKPWATGLILRHDITQPSNHRSVRSFGNWLQTHQLTGICGIDTRALTHHLRQNGAQNGIIQHAESQKDIDLEQLNELAHRLPNMNGLDIALRVSCEKAYVFEEIAAPAGAPHVVVIDYGVKRNILHCLAEQGLRLTVVPCKTSAEDILAMSPDGVFLSNGPGDPSATGVYSSAIIRALLEKNLPIFGICLGHQLLALALGGRTEKLPFGHRGANHPVLNVESGAVEITSQNHGFHVIASSLPENAAVTHTSLFDGSNEGFRLKDRPVFCVQYHPESSPGPHDSRFLFKKFFDLLNKQKRKAA